ncbi:uncharacterized protein LTR77_007461 [Saxophila tyrrhenica]|uniref:Uncharacterized protein n=1 Tax=Saxophila tyrrhenica TaxID=1690608 RepID=A0AAV9P8J2_9PEZI|nr:hypothetical protein LTR77_007461 [Saxophila tyrrhenica]
MASSNLTFESAYGRPPQQSTTTKGSWLARVGHRASHIPNRGLTSNSRETLPLRAGGYRSHEQLPGLQKTLSGPSSPASPTETEFGSTPIDASFGDRIDTPPDRRPPDRPGLNDKGAAGSQRSRSGTAIQVEPAQGAYEAKMDKYAKQAGDNAYDSDAEADDEFERSDVGVVSPTVPAHFDDDLSDHPSESEDERGFVDGEDTPTTQGWPDREGRSPMGKITQWSEEQVADYIVSLSPALKQYSQAFADEVINGQALVSLGHDELKELGVNSIGHRLTILKAVYDQKIRSGVKIEEDDYVPLSAEGDKGDLGATQDDIARIIESIRLRDQRIIAAEAELRQLKNDLDRISDENRKLREETLPVIRLMKDQRTPLPDPAGGSIPSPRDTEAFKPSEPPPTITSKGSSLSRKFSTKKLFLGSAPKQASPTHVPPISHTPQPREVRDDGGGHLEASAAAMAASTHLTASMTSQTSPNSVHGQQLSPTSPAYSNQAPSSGGSYHPQRSFPRDGQSTRHDRHGHDDRGYSTNSQWSTASTAVAEPEARADRSRRGQQPQPSPRDDDGSSTRERGDRGDRDNPQVEIFKSFRVSIEDPCRVVLPVALKRYNITDDWRQYALYIVHGDQERCLGLEEKPLMLFKQLDKEGRKPMFMLRRHAAPQEGWSNSSSVGQSHAHAHAQDGGGGKQIPGGVL